MARVAWQKQPCRQIDGCAFLAIMTGIDDDSIPDLLEDSDDKQESKEDEESEDESRDDDDSK